PRSSSRPRTVGAMCRFARKRDALSGELSQRKDRQISFGKIDLSHRRQAASFHSSCRHAAGVLETEALASHLSGPWSRNRRSSRQEGTNDPVPESTRILHFIDLQSMRSCLRMPEFYCCIDV